MRYGRLTPDVVVKARYTNQASLIKPGGYKTMKALYLYHCQSLTVTSLILHSYLSHFNQAGVSPVVNRPTKYPYRMSSEIPQKMMQPTNGQTPEGP